MIQKTIKYQILDAPLTMWPVAVLDKSLFMVPGMIVSLRGQTLRAESDLEGSFAASPHSQFLSLPFREHTHHPRDKRDSSLALGLRAPPRLPGPRFELS